MRQTNLDEVKEFVDRLESHAKRKALLYDGCQGELTPDETLRYAIEEIGEVASAMTRGRWLLAREECIDLAHCAMLIWVVLAR